MNILESRENLENFLQERDKALERKLFTKFKLQQKQKNIPDSNPWEMPTNKGQL